MSENDHESSHGFEPEPPGAGCAARCTDKNRIGTKTAQMPFRHRDGVMSLDRCRSFRGSDEPLLLVAIAVWLAAKFLLGVEIFISVLVVHLRGCSCEISQKALQIGAYKREFVPKKPRSVRQETHCQLDATRFSAKFPRWWCRHKCTPSNVA